MRIGQEKLTTLNLMTFLEGVEEVKRHMTLIRLKIKQITQLNDKMRTGAMFKSDSQAVVS